MCVFMTDDVLEAVWEEQQEHDFQKWLISKKYLGVTVGLSDCRYCFKLWSLHYLYSHARPLLVCHRTNIDI